MIQSNRNKYEVDYTSKEVGGSYSNTNQKSLMVCADQLQSEKVSWEHSTTDDNYCVSLLWDIFSMLNSPQKKLCLSCKEWSTMT